MKRSVLLLVLFVCALAIFAAQPTAAQSKSSEVKTPSQFLGFEVGADRTLADYHQIVSYFKALAASSPRVQVETLGKTTLDNDMIAVIVSTPENLSKKERYKEIARKLSDPRGLTAEQIDALAREGKAIVLVTCNIHSTEIGSSQMAMEWIHDLAVANDPETMRRLSNVILVVMPSLNPDGQIMVTEWYRKYLGTRYEGGQMPYLYHHYVGHDNNRDWFMLTQKETRLTTHLVYQEWYPQIWLDEHQMGTTGPRLFVPPFADPIAKAVNPLTYQGATLIGANMAWRLQQKDKHGVIFDWLYDSYWPGDTQGTSTWKNITGVLTEAASARIATPVEIEPGELSGGSKGLADYGKQVNFPDPWKGGTWRLRDIMDYERIASDSLLETATEHRDDFLRGIARMAQQATAEGKPGEYFRIRIDASQKHPNANARLAHLLRAQGVDVQFAAAERAFYIPTAQPYNAYLGEMLGTQRYPEVRPAAGAAILPPYDITTWSLPLMLGADVDKVTLAANDNKKLRAAADGDWPEVREPAPAAAYMLSHEQNEATRLVNLALAKGIKVSVAKQPFTADAHSYAAGTFVLEPSPELAKLATAQHLQLAPLAALPQNLAKLRPARVALYKPFNASMDEGWTRWLLEQYSFDLKSVDNKAIRAGKLDEKFDVVLLADIDKEVIVEGVSKRGDGAMKYRAEMPPEYQGGIGKEGVTALKEFVEKGGTIISMGGSGDFVADNFNVPVRNVLGSVKSDDFLCPGSLLRAKIDTTHPVGYGMEPETAIFLDDDVAYQTSLPGLEVQRYVLATYPEDAKDILMSGWIRGAERLQRRAAAVAFTMGKGKLVMFGFRPQYRAQTEGTFKMLFNAIQWAATENRVVVWDGEQANIGSGWVNPTTSSIGPQTAEAHSGKTALEFKFKAGSEWRGAGWNWFNFKTGTAIGTDVSAMKNLTFWIKTKGKGGALQINLLCNGDKLDTPEEHTAKVQVLKYSPDLLDGKWHEVVIPLADLTPAQGFNPRIISEIHFGFAADKDTEGSFIIDDIAFDDRQ